MLVPGTADFLPHLAYMALELLMALLAVLGNLLVCWAVYLNSNLQNVTNYFVVSLAAADVAVGLLAIPFAITISTGFCASFYGCLFIACFVLVLTQSSIFSLLAIAIDRFIAIRTPLRYNALVTSSRAKGIIAVCWVLSLVIGLTPMLGWHKSGPGRAGLGQNSSQNCSGQQMACLFESVVTMEYMVYYNFFACVLLPLLLMFGIYLRIFMAARRQLQQIENKAVHARERSRSILQKEVHAAKSLAFIMGLFAACWLPLHVLNCYIHFCPRHPRPPLWLMDLAILLSHANSVVNPLIYAYRIREFRHTFRKIIGRHLLGRRERFRRSAASRRTSVHGAEAEGAGTGLGEGVLDLYAGGELGGLHPESCLGRVKGGLEWHQNGSAVDGEANGHAVLACANGGLAGTDPEAAALEGSEGS
ncbi:hypothetical protein lerEdw1_019336 [Lerista edwardsae]|nr:hypothetical protein lerEdw1_019336 [Lerista edwardsae]